MIRSITQRLPRPAWQHAVSWGAHQSDDLHVDDILSFCGITYTYNFCGLFVSSPENHFPLYVYKMRRMVTSNRSHCCVRLVNPPVPSVCSRLAFMSFATPSLVAHSGSCLVYMLALAATRPPASPSILFTYLKLWTRGKTRRSQTGMR